MITIYPPGNRSNDAASRQSWDWPDTKAWLAAHQSTAAKHETPLWTPLTLDHTADKPRAAGQRASFFACEWDKISSDDLDRILEVAEGADCVVYTTHSHTEEAPRIRLAARSTRDILREEQPSVVRLLTKLTEARAARESETLSQAWYAPGKDSEIWTFEGEPVDVDEALRVCPPKRGTVYDVALPAELLAEIPEDQRAAAAARELMIHRPEQSFRMACIVVRDCAVQPQAAVAIIQRYIQNYQPTRQPRSNEHILAKCVNAAQYGHGEIGAKLRPFRPFDDSGNALRLLDANRGLLKFTEEWWGYEEKEGRWIQRGHPTWLMVRLLDELHADRGRIAPTDEGFREAIAKWRKKCRDKGKLDAAVSLASRHPSCQIQVSDLDADPDLFSLGAVGTLDLSAKPVVRPCDPADLITSRGCPVAPCSKAPRFQKFLEEVFLGKLDTISYIQRFFGSCLTGSVEDHVMQFWSGSGSNGKSTLLKIMRGVFGDYACPMPPRLLNTRTGEPHPTEFASLRGKRLVFGSETEKGKKLDETVVKSLTSADEIKVRQMNENFWNMVPTAKFVVAGNHKPVITGTDDGIWRRVHLVEFAAKFEGSANVKKLDEILLQAEMPGILGWLIEGFISWRERELDPPQSVQLATSDFREKSDSMARFLKDCTVEEEKAKIPQSELWHLYKKWAADSNEYAKGKHVFLDEIREKFPTFKSGVAMLRGLRAR